MKILLAEDERDLSRTICRFLEANKYDVECVYDGQSALEYGVYAQYDAIILDVMMPKMNGFDVVKNLRRNNISTPVMILTALSETDDKVLGLDNGADDYLTKPFQSKELLARLRALIRRSSDVSENYAIGNVTLNHDHFSLEAKTSVRLTNTEYKLMECLIHHQNGFLTTERIMELVWDDETDAEVNVVWAYLSALRKKLAHIGANVTIKASRGVGYRLEVSQ